ncbi:MAG TPA: FAD:protein FMN transferase [Verrucomicrobiae bacterium]|jgi:thiamine biosynthesis lipoprotein|nr:FAD:protein FMN transferase [Verrucomicrobiae bacterium]
MKQTKLIMGMPITVEIVNKNTAKHFATLFDYFRAVDARYSTYKKDSEISLINDGLTEAEWSTEMKSVLELCEQTRKDTNGYFNITHHGKRDPSGLVKGWAVANAADMLLKNKVTDFYIEAGGDIQVHGTDARHHPWTIGIRSPFNIEEIIKTIRVSSEGVATSGTYIRGQHIYNPFRPESTIGRVRSVTVIGPNVYEADRFATAAFAMGEQGIGFIESTPSLEGYMVTDDKVATYTSGFERYVPND